MKDYKRTRTRERNPQGRSNSYFGTEKRGFRRDSNEASERSNNNFQERPRKRFNRDSGKPFERFSGRSEGKFKREYKTRDAEMHQIICDKCGKESTVPFKPMSNKPLYCSDCFRKKEDSSQKREFNMQGRSNVTSEDLEKINQKLDKILQVLKIQ